MLDTKEAKRLLIKDRNKYIRYFLNTLKEYVEEKSYDLAETVILEGARTLGSIVGAIDYLETANLTNGCPRFEPVLYSSEDDEEDSDNAPMA